MKTLWWETLSAEDRAESCRAQEMFVALEEHIDEATGRVLQPLDEMDVADDTVGLSFTALSLGTCC